MTPSCGSDAAVEGNLFGGLPDFPVLAAVDEDIHTLFASGEVVRKVPSDTTS